ncbi:MAG: CoA-binding protein [Candidatus Geothermincolales bacterium]
MASGGNRAAVARCIIRFSKWREDVNVAMERGERVRIGGDPLDPFFYPRGVVIVGATRTPGFGYMIPLVLRRRGFAERVFLVNPAGGELHGYRLHASLEEVPDWVDLAVVLVPARVVPRALEEIGRKGIRCAVVESAGFAETGEEGRRLQEEARKVAASYGIRVIGPNCVGVVNTDNGFSTVETLDEAMVPGPVGIVAQSGVFGNILLDMLPGLGVRISKAFTLGNRMDVDEVDALQYLYRDPSTRVIMMYLEGAARGRELVSALKGITPKKPVLVLKSGRTEVGRKATASHTGSLSGEDRLYGALFAQTGAIRADSLEELVDLARVFATQPCPRGGRLGVVTTSGSLGALASDTACSNGLELPPLSPAAVEKMRDGAPSWMNVRNPLDVGPSGRFHQALCLMMEEEGMDMVLGIYVVPYAIAGELKAAGLGWELLVGRPVEAREKAPDKPLVLCSLGKEEFVRDLQGLAGDTIPVLSSPERAARALAALHKYTQFRRGREETV